MSCGSWSGLIPAGILSSRRCGPRRAFAGFAAEALAPPVDVIERQRGDLATAQAVAHQQHRNRPIALAARRAAIDTASTRPTSSQLIDRGMLDSR